MFSHRIAILLGAATLSGCGFFKYSSGDSGSLLTETGEGEGEGEGSSGSSDEGTVDDCDQEVDEPDQTGEDCVTATIGCGDSFVSTTEGGANNLDGEAYVKWFCLPTAYDTFQGGERVYEFIHPGTGDVYFNFDSPCTDLSVFVMYWVDADTCPVLGNSVQECDTTTSGDSNSVRVWDNEENRYMVVIDSEEGDEGPFGLTVDCAD